MDIPWELSRALHTSHFIKLSLHGDSNAEMLRPELSREDNCMSLMAGSEGVCEHSPCCESVTWLVTAHPSQNWEMGSGEELRPHSPRKQAKTTRSKPQRSLK